MTTATTATTTTTTTRSALASERITGRGAVVAGEEGGGGERKRQRVQKTKLFGRTHWVVKEDGDEEERGREAAAQHQNAALASIKNTLGTDRLWCACVHCPHAPSSAA
jgi:uncharacterized OsmC-like protein